MLPQVQEKLSLKVMINKNKNKVVFAEADIHFADILLSFLTLPLGRILQVFQNHYGTDYKAPKIGSLSNLYRSLTNLDSSHFVSKDAKNTLLNPISSFEAEYDMLKLNICAPPSAQCPSCFTNEYGARRYSLAIANLTGSSPRCRCGWMSMTQKYGRPYEYNTGASSSSEGVFTLPDVSFIISDDLQIFPNDKGVFGVITFLGITDMDEAEPITVDFRFSEIVNLLKASLTSSTPLSDVVLKKTNSESPQPMTPLPKIAEEKSVVILKVMIQRSTGKFLSAQAKPDFIEFLSGLFSITLGGLEHKLGGTTFFKATKNLYRSTTQLIDCKYFFKTSYIKERLMNLKLPHHFIPRNTATYLNGSRTYEVTDDLTAKPFCIVSILSRLKEQKIPMSDMEEVEMQIGVNKGLRILIASLTSNSVISDALLSDEIKNKKPVKREADIFDALSSDQIKAKKRVKKEVIELV